MNIFQQLVALTEAIEGLSFSISNKVDCGCLQGEYPPQPEGSQGGNPPAGYVQYAEVDQRKCRLANMVVDDLLYLLDQLIANNVQAIAELGLGGISALFALVLALLPAGPVGIAILGLGTLAAIAGLFLTSSIDVGDLRDKIQASRQDIVCGLYASGNSTAAYATVRTILQDAGATAGQLGLMDAMNLASGFTSLFFKLDDPKGDQIEARLDGYPITTDCQACAVECAFSLQFGSGSFRYDGEPFTLSSGPSGGVHILNIVSFCNFGDCPTPGNWCVQIDSTTINTNTTIYTRKLHGWNGACTLNTNDYQSSSPSFPPLGQSLAVGQTEFTDGSPFTITMRIFSRTRALVPGESPQSHGGAC